MFWKKIRACVTSSRYMLTAFFLVAAISATQSHGEAAAQSQWVYPDANGKLVYKTLSKGDKIMDFSYAGYGGGGVTISTISAQCILHRSP